VLTFSSVARSPTSRHIPKLKFVVAVKPITIIGGGPGSSHPGLKVIVRRSWLVPGARARSCPVVTSQSLTVAPRPYSDHGIAIGTAEHRPNALETRSAPAQSPRPRFFDAVPSWPRPRSCRRG